MLFVIIMLPFYNELIFSINFIYYCVFFCRGYDNAMRIIPGWWNSAFISFIERITQWTQCRVLLILLCYVYSARITTTGTMPLIYIPRRVASWVGYSGQQRGELSHLKHICRGVAGSDESIEPHYILAPGQLIVFDPPLFKQKTCLK